MDFDQDRRPRQMVFFKMEKLLRDMQNSDTGIQVRCQKIFLTTIPCAFTGYDLCDWLMQQLNIEDPTEALHLANLLCRHGYFFPVGDARNFAVKDDNTLYRFQSPYFWPSQNWQPDSIDYAIYLAKRTMRNKQRHGLEDYEQIAFNKLQKMLSDKWQFVFMQAEEQVRIAHERKKADKVVLDSQERAFWKVHRPPPGHVKCLDEGMKRNMQPGQLCKKKIAETYIQESAYLKRALAQPRNKVSKSIEGMLQRCEQYFEHDPFLVNCQPSNPWVTDDPTMWMINTVICDSPADQRVKRWAFSLDEILADLTGRQELAIFLQKEYSHENLRFWEACEQLKYGPVAAIPDKVKEIYAEFLAKSAPCEVNIDSKTMEITDIAMKKPNRYTFEEAQSHIYLLMKKDSYPRFLRSEHYKNLLANATQPNSKKKFFGFAGSRKKSPNPSPNPARRRSSTSSSNSSSNQRLSEGSISAIPDVKGKHSYSTGNIQELDTDQPILRGFIRSRSKRHSVGSTSSNRSSGRTPRHIPSPKFNNHSLSVPGENSKALVARDPNCMAVSLRPDPNNMTVAVPCKLNPVTPWETE